MPQVHDAAWEAALYALNGLAGNPVNQSMSASDMVEKAINIGVTMARRWEGILGASNMTPTVMQQFSVTPIPAAPTINYTPSGGSTVNNATKSVSQSSTPTTVKNPDGTPIAHQGGVSE